MTLHASGQSNPSTPHDEDGGIVLRDLPAGSVLEIHTRNNTYTVIPQPSGDAVVWGHPEYCPEPALFSGLGGTYQTGVFREGYLAPGMRLSIPLGERRIATSRIVSITRRQKQ